MKIVAPSYLWAPNVYGLNKNPLLNALELRPQNSYSFCFFYWGGGGEGEGKGISCVPNSPITFPANKLGWQSCASRETTLKEARGVEPGCVEIMPRKRVTFHVRTWLYSEQIETRFFSLSITLTTGLRWTMNVWKSCGPWPTVSGCCTITLTVPELVP